MLTESNAKKILQTSLQAQMKQLNYEFIKRNMFKSDIAFLQKTSGFYTGLLIDIQRDYIFTKLVTNHEVSQLFSPIIPMKYSSSDDVESYSQLIYEEFITTGITKIDQNKLIPFDVNELYTKHILPTHADSVKMISLTNIDYAKSTIMICVNDFNVEITHWPEYPNLSANLLTKVNNRHIDISGNKLVQFQQNYRFKSRDEYCEVLNKIINFVANIDTKI